MVELRGFEPLACTLRTYRSSQLSYSPTLDVVEWDKLPLHS
jgi:hypothetical protein